MNVDKKLQLIMINYFNRPLIVIKEINRRAVLVYSR